MMLIDRTKAVARRILERSGYEVRRIQKDGQRGTSGFPYITHQTVGNVDFEFWIADATARDWYDAPLKDQNFPEISELLRCVPQGNRVLEIGSNQGFFTVLLGLLVGREGRVLGVEAHPKNVLVAQANVGLNRLADRCSVIHAAAAETSGGVLRFSDSMNSAVESELSLHYVTAPTVSGDDLDAKHGPFDLLKVDVEGFELSVLKGCRRLLARRSKLALELHLDLLRRYDARVEEIFELIRVSDYQGVTIVRSPQNEVRPFSVGTLPHSGIVNLLLTPKR